MSVISAGISIGASRTDIEVLKHQLAEYKQEINVLTDLTHRLEVESATTHGALQNIDRSLVEIKEDVKDLKREQIPTGRNR